MMPLKQSTAEHYRNYERLSGLMAIPKKDGLPEFDYSTRRFVERLLNDAEGSFDQLGVDFTLILNNYLTYGRRIFDLHNRKVKSSYHKQLQVVLKKYRVNRYIAEQGRGRIPRSINIEQLMFCFPHLTAKVFIFDLGVEPAMTDAKMVENQFTNLSPACATLSSFALLPQYEDDADENYFDVIKTMLLFHYEETEELQKDNEMYNRQDSETKMSRLISIAKVTYESYHMSPDMRWFCYNAYFIHQFNTLKLYNHAGPSTVFDQRFKSLVEDVAETFKLKSGSKRMVTLSQKQMRHFLRKQEIIEDLQ